MRWVLISAFCWIAPMVQALDVFTEYRIRGDEIAQVLLIEPEIEDPIALEIILTLDRKLLIESDQPLGACKMALENGKANGASASVEIVVHQTADTMNGSVVIQCAVMFP